MNPKLSILFYGKKSRLTTSGQLPIYMRVTVDGQRIEITTKRYADPNKWSFQLGKLKGSTEEARSFNCYLDILKAKVYDHQRDLIHGGQEVNFENMRSKLLGLDTKKRMLVSIFEMHNLQMKSQVGAGYAIGTWQRFQTTLDHLKQFLLEKRNCADIDIRMIDHAFISDFDFYLRSPHNVQKKTKTLQLRCGNNSTVKYIKNFKKIVLICIANGWLNRNPFINYKGKVKEVERNYLTTGELELLLNKECATERLSQVKDIFLFACYTGLAYIDVKNLEESNLVTGIDGCKWIYTHRQKTDIPSNIPLLPIAESIINKYKNHPFCVSNKKLLPVLSNQKTNEYLRELTSICGITKNLTFHSARHTFATTVTLTNHVSIESVSKMLGHKNIKTTQHYAKILDRKVSYDMQQLRSKLSKDLDAYERKTAAAEPYAKPANYTG